MKNTKEENEEVAGGMCSGITMITKGVIYHGVAVPNNRCGHYYICNLIVTPFLCCFIFFCKDRIISQYQGGGLVAFGGQQT